MIIKNIWKENQLTINIKKTYKKKNIIIKEINYDLISQFIDGLLKYFLKYFLKYVYLNKFI